MDLARKMINREPAAAAVAAAGRFVSAAAYIYPENCEKIVSCEQ